MFKGLHLKLHTELTLLSNHDKVILGSRSLDHVYEFMGGMNLAVRNITGKDPDAYLSDYRKIIIVCKKSKKHRHRIKNYNIKSDFYQRTTKRRSIKAIL